ncbi:MAG: 2-oxo acid dehydrogenase subunit E2 [Peptococcaceae bacterium]|jgi:pyruvate dehydrogenase E2 component (dihydrolipoamide acetyltransferase)|nr:2-oxo acid dehydrogenase subunit E2 [Peptococcaceae bacterium]
MAYRLLLPKFGMAMESAKIIEWKKEIGDLVEREEAVLVVENEKLTNDIISMEAGVLLEKVAQVGETYLVGDLLAYLGKDGEAVADAVSAAAGAPAAGAPPTAVGTPPATGALPAAAGALPAAAGALPAAAVAPSQTGGRMSISPAAKKLAAELGVDFTRIPVPAGKSRIDLDDVKKFAEEQKNVAPATVRTQASADIAAPAAAGVQAVSASQEGKRISISPLARKMAEQLGLDYRQITGTGPGGRIDKEDVLTFAAVQKNVAMQTIDKASATSPAPQTVTAPAATLPAPPGSGYTVVPYAGMRKAVGERMQYAWTHIPMVTHHVRADVGALLELRRQLNEGVEDKNLHFSINNLLLKITAIALAKMPVMNATFENDEIRIHDHVNLGMATALDNGLIVPVIHGAESKSLAEISGEAKDLAEAARSGRLTADNVSGGTFTVSNLGGYQSVELFTPIINPPQAAILGVGLVMETAVPIDGEIRVRSLMGLSLTYDHRVMDGAVAAAFMRMYMELLEKPLQALLR